MKKSTNLFVLIISVFLITSCGKDGESGSASLSLDWDYFVDAYNDNNPSMPSAVSRNYEYTTKPGSFSCEYACSDGSGNYWFMEYDYTISINKGESGKLFSKGEDGKSRHHKMFLHGVSDPSFTVSEKSATKQMKTELSSFELNLEDFKKVYHGEPETESFSENGFTTTIVKRKFTLE